MESKHKEGKIAKSIEKQTAKAPSDIFLWSSIATMGVSLCFKLYKKDRMALYIGQWAESILLLGVYNKLVKVEGSDKSEKDK
ncbi:hypothetical protein [Algoriphagus vanfongensis]|uniref:hypothetical protein n=1 Tax=Algoriphagus vanfongensis TaxID=426371 RepID=UPI000419D355|nr:hypothetical protein [Algoriphagus vanfongensis]